MTITHIITRLILGGAQAVVIRTCAEQVRRGHRVVLMHGPIYGPEGSLLDEAVASGAELVEVAPLRRAVSPWRDWRCYRQLRHRLRDLKPAVVHTHSSKAGIVGRAAAWAEGVPCVVHTVHGLAFHDQQKRWTRRAFIEAERLAARRCHHLIAVSQSMVDAFAANRIAQPRRFTVIPSAVELERFDEAGEAREPDSPRNGKSHHARLQQKRRLAREELSVDPSTPLIGILARLDKHKGQRDLIDILPTLVQRFGELRVIFIGGGYDREDLERRVCTRLGENETNRVIFTGLVPPQRVAELLPAIDVSVLPSYQEGQSLTLAESLLCACAIVGYDTGGIASVCIDGQTGRLVPRGDQDALAQAIIWMLEHPAERRRLTAQGQAHVRQTLEPRMMTDAIERVYRRVLGGDWVIG